jgi:AraC family cel operon transcriptional repressor
MNTLQKTDPDLARLKIKAMLAEIFTRFFLEINPGALPCRPLWFDKLCAEMKKPENLSGGLKTMLALAPCTQEHLCKCFRKYSGVSPTEFINEQRIIVAAKQIVETDTKFCRSLSKRL